MGFVVVSQQLRQPLDDACVVGGLRTPLGSGVGHLAFSSVAGPMQKTPDPPRIVVMVQHTFAFYRQVNGLLADGAQLTLLDP